VCATGLARCLSSQVFPWVGLEGRSVIDSSLLTQKFQNFCCLNIRQLVRR
jgi:hypothetical protein